MVRGPSSLALAQRYAAWLDRHRNAIFALRYRMPAADIAVAEEPFESGGMKFNRGSFILRNVSQADVHRETTALGLKAFPLASAPTVKAHPARAARVALMVSGSLAFRKNIAAALPALNFFLPILRSRLRMFIDTSPKSMSTGHGARHL